MNMTEKSNLKAARRMRKAPASNEARLWSLLRNRQVGSLKFRRQVPIRPYIADFVCYSRRLIVEADGPFHGDHDEPRDAWLRDQGFRILRFPNEMIASDHQSVLAAILGAIETRGTFGEPPHPTPFGGHLLPQGEKETGAHSSGD